MHFGAVALAVSLVSTVGNAFPQQGAVPLNGTSSDIPQSSTAPLDSTSSTIPQATTAPVNSTSSTFPLTTSASTCWTSCHLNGPDYQQWVWRPIKYTETVTYAPVITVINTRRNTTRTVTNTAALPGNYTPQLTNEAGTAICPITLFDNTTTTLTYPQEFGDYGTDYWLALTCPQTRRDVTLKSHPDFNEWFFTGTRTRLRQPGGFSTQSGIYDDVRGINWGCLTERDPVGEFSAFLIDAFPDEAAFPSCMHSVSVPVHYLTTAAFLTVPSVSYEGDEDTTGDPPSAKPTSSTAGGVPISTGRTDFPTTTAQPGNPPEAPAPSTKAPTVLPPPETTVQAPVPDETSQPEQPPVVPAPPSTEAGEDSPPASDSTPASDAPMQIPSPGETSQPGQQPPAAPEPSTVVGTILPPSSDRPVQAPGAEETSQPIQNVPVGSTSVAVIPTAIPTVISGTSTSVPAVVVGSSTLTAGQTIVVDNTPIIVPTANQPAPQPATQGPDNDQPTPQPQSQPPAIIIGGSTHTLSAAAPPPPSAAPAPAPEPPTLTLADGRTITPSGSAYIISGQTLAPDSPALTLSGGADSPSPTVLALTTNAAGSPIVLVGDSSTVPYNTPPPSPSPSPSSAAAAKPALLQEAPTLPTLTLADGRTIAPSGSAYVISGQTLSQGSSPLTLGAGEDGNGGSSSSPSATVIALTTDAAGSRVVVVDGSSSTVAYATPAPDSSGGNGNGNAPLVIFGTTVTPSGSGGGSGGGTYVYAGQTLTLGGTVTVGSAGTGAKTTLVMTTDEAGRTVVVQGGAGRATSASTRTGSEGLGGLINSGLGGSGRTRSSASATASAGSSGSALPSSSSTATAAGGREKVADGGLFALVVLGGLLVGGF